MIATLIGLAALVLLFFLSSFFSSAETALFSLNPIQIHRLRKNNAGTAALLESLLARPNRLLSTILIGNTLVNVSAASLGYVVADRIFPGYGVAIAIPFMTVMLLVFGEVAPKRLAMKRPVWLSSLYVRPLAELCRLFGPVRMLMERISHMCRLDGMLRHERQLSEDEFKTVVDVGAEEGILDRDENLMVHGIIGLEDATASDVMTPRVDLVAIDIEDPLEEAEKTARNSRFRFLPVCEGDLDHVQGFLDVPRFLLDKGHDLGRAMISPFFVPETIALDVLLARFQKENRRIAFVVDEFGGTAGLITRGDILEEIVDDVHNEFGDTPPEIQKLNRNRWLVDGMASIDEVNFQLGLALEAEGVDRISGWVTAQAQSIPRKGTLVEAQGCRALVERVHRRRVQLVRIEKVFDTDADEKSDPDILDEYTGRDFAWGKTS